MKMSHYQKNKLSLPSTPETSMAPRHPVKHILSSQESPKFCCFHKPVLQANEVRVARRIATVGAIVSLQLAKEADKIANAFDLRITVPDQTFEEAMSVIQSHARYLLSIKEPIESQSWKDVQRTLRRSSSELKKDIYTIIQAKPGSERVQLRKLYTTLFNNVTKLDYAARDGDALVIQHCYKNIVEALADILSRI